MALTRLRINAGWSEPSLITQCWESYFAAPFVIFITRWLPWLPIISIPVKPYHMRLQCMSGNDITSGYKMDKNTGG